MSSSQNEGKKRYFKKGIKQLLPENIPSDHLLQLAPNKSSKFSCKLILGSTPAPLDVGFPVCCSQVQGFAPSAAIEWLIIKVRPALIPLTPDERAPHPTPPGRVGAEGLLARRSPVWCGTATCKCSDCASVYTAVSHEINQLARCSPGEGGSGGTLISITC